MGVNIVEARRQINMNEPHLVTAQSGNNEYSDFVASFQSDSTYVLKQLIVDLPYKATGYPCIRVTRCGKNLFDINLLARNDITVQNGEAVGTLNAFFAHYGARISDVANKIDRCLPLRTYGNKNLAWTYTVRTDANVSTSSYGPQPFWKYKDGTNKVTLTVPNNQTTNRTVTAVSYNMYSSSLPNFAGISAYGTGGNIWHFSNMQFELGNTLTAFEPFHGNTYDIYWDGVISKNLLNPADVVNAYVDNSGNFTADANDRCVIVRCQPNTTYTWTWNRTALTSSTDDSGIVAFPYYPIPGDKGVNKLTANATSGQGRSFTTGAYDKWLAIKIAQVTKSDFDATVQASQLELGSIATAHEQFNTIYGGTYDLVSGVLTSTKASDGTDLATAAVYQIAPMVIPALRGVNNIWSDEGTVSVKYWTN